MQHVLQISRKIDYALRAAIHLAGLPMGEVVPLKEIIRRLDLPKDFAAKIMQALAQGGLVRAVRGVHGGYALARSPSEISFLEVIEAAEGPIQLNVCLDDKSNCAVSDTCTMHQVWKAGQERMLELYRSTRLADLVPGPWERALVQIPPRPREPPA